MQQNQPGNDYFGRHDAAELFASQAKRAAAFAMPVKQVIRRQLKELPDFDPLKGRRHPGLNQLPQQCPLRWKRWLQRTPHRAGLRGGAGRDPKAPSGCPRAVHLPSRSIFSERVFLWCHMGLLLANAKRRAEDHDLDSFPTCTACHVDDQWINHAESRRRDHLLEDAMHADRVLADHPMRRRNLARKHLRRT